MQKLYPNYLLLNLKSCGLSKQKVKGNKKFSQTNIRTNHLNPRLLTKMSDEDAIIYLI